MELNHEALTTRRAEPKEMTRKLEETVTAQATQHASRWRNVALTAKDQHHRAAAIYLAVYGSKDQALADTLAMAAQDPYSLVRNNAIRSISVLAVSATGRTLTFDPAPVLNLFDSVHWTDWNKASAALVSLTEARDPKLLAEIAARGGEMLRQIAKWPPMHSSAATTILERIG